MKKTYVLSALLLVSVLLSACACEHVWTDADCLNPQVCSKCEEISGEALGHDWIPASCTAPETCSRCGEIRGASLGHSYGDWHFGKTDMTHICEACGLEETTELDRKLYLGTLLTGFWEFSGFFEGDSFHSAYDVNIPGYNIQFMSDGTAFYCDTQQTYSCTWDFQEYSVIDEKEHYYFDLFHDAERAANLLLRLHEDEQLLYIFFADDVQVILERNDKNAASILGAWGGSSGYQGYGLVFHEDRTVTCEFEEEFTGRWYVLPQQSFFGYTYFGIFVQYDLHGEQQNLMCTVTMEPSDDSTSTTTDYIATELSMRYQDGLIYFKPMTVEEMEFLLFTQAQGPKEIAGTWTAKYIRINNSETGESSKVGANNYSMTFHEDGTFTADVGRRMSGTWIYRYSSGKMDYPAYYYTLIFKGQRSDVYATLDSSGELTLTEYEGNVGKTLILEQYSEKEAELFRQGPELIKGSWISTIYSRYDKTTHEYIGREETDAYSVTFFDDGTFSGSLNAEVGGTWKFLDYDSTTGHTYQLMFSDTGESGRFSINPDGFLCIDLYQENVHVFFIFLKNTDSSQPEPESTN